MCKHIKTKKTQQEMTKKKGGREKGNTRKTERQLEREREDRKRKEG